MRKITLTLLFITLFCFLTMSASASPVISPANAEIAVGNSISFTVSGSGEMLPSLIWTCSNETVGTVDSFGNFTALSPGTANVTAASADDPSYSVIASVVVCDPPPTVEPDRSVGESDLRSGPGDWSGSGTDSDPYLITSGVDLALLAERVNAGETYVGTYFLVTADIALSGMEWTPIGMKDTPFCGIFDGGTRTISGLTISDGGSYCGLFGYVSDGAVLTRVQLTDVNVSSTGNRVGGLVGHVKASNFGSVVTLENCSSSGSVAGVDDIGGLVGVVTYSSGSVTITACNSSGPVTGVSKTGGLIGSAWARDSGSVTITACNSNSSVIGGYYTGGLVGWVYTYGSGSVTITTCYSCGSVTSTKNDTGGLIGSVIAMDSGSVVITACYSCGYVTGSGDIGGLVASVEASDSSSVIIIEASVALSPTVARPPNVTSSADVGRIKGSTYGEGTLTLIDTYALSTMSAGGATDGIDVSPEDAASQNFYEDVLGWDFLNVWTMDKNQSLYPVLRGQASVDPVTPPVPSEGINRDITLLIDTSYSTYPMETMMKSSVTNLCSKLLDSEIPTRIAVVAYNDEVVQVTDFTSDLSNLKSGINSLSWGIYADMYSGLQKVDEIFTAAPSSENTERSIVVLSAGLPDKGNTKRTGILSMSPSFGLEHGSVQYGNAVYELYYTSLKTKYEVYTLQYLKSELLNDQAISTSLLSAMQNSGYYTSDDIDNLGLIPGNKDIPFASTIGGSKNLEYTTYYSDDLFQDQSTTYNHNLAKISLGLATSSFSMPGTSYIDEISDTEAITRFGNVKDAYQRLGFKNTEYYNYGTPLNDTTNKAAYSIAEKKVIIDSKNYTIFTVVVRGGGYGGEWASNFDIGTGAYSTGFSEPADVILESLKSRISAVSDPSKVKVWITGFSRGAAISNLVAGHLDRQASSLGLQKENIYAYTFATPQGVDTSYAVNTDVHTDYTNIFNIVNPSDLVPTVPMSSWGYDRYGTTYYFNYNEDNSLYSAISDKYETLTGSGYTPQDMTLSIAFLDLRLASIFDNKSEYAKTHSAYIHDLLEIIFHDSDMDVSALLSLCDNIERLYPNGASAVESAEALTKNTYPLNTKAEEIRKRSHIQKDRINELDSVLLDAAALWLDIIISFLDDEIVNGFIAIGHLNGDDAFTSTGEVDRFAAVIDSIISLLENDPKIGSLLKQHSAEVYMAWLLADDSVGTLYTTDILSQSEIATDTVTVTVLADGSGTVYGTQQVLSGSKIIIEATANDDCAFIGWYDSNSNLISKDAVYSTNIDADTKFIAVFSDGEKTGSVEVVKNTVSEGTWSASEPAKIVHVLSPARLSTLTAPIITHNKNSLMLTDIILVKSVNGIASEVPAKVLDNGQIEINGDISEASMLEAAFLGCQLGDVTGDGKVTSGDAAFIAQHAAKLRQLNETQLFYADVTGDGKATSGDAAFIAQYAAKLRDTHYHLFEV